MSVTCHCMLPDVASSSKTRKPLTDQGLEETQTNNYFSQKDDSIPSIIEATGTNINYSLRLFHIVSTIRLNRSDKFS